MENIENDSTLKYRYMRNIKPGKNDRQDRLIDFIYARTDYYMVYGVSDEKKGEKHNELCPKIDDAPICCTFYSPTKEDRLLEKLNRNVELEKRRKEIGSEKLSGEFEACLNKNRFEDVSFVAEDEQEKESKYRRFFNRICHEFLNTMGLLNDVPLQERSIFKLKIATNVVHALELGEDDLEISYVVHQFRDLRKEMKEVINRQKMNHIYYALFSIIFSLGCVAFVSFFSTYEFNKGTHIREISAIINAACLGGLVASLLKSFRNEFLSGYMFEHLLIIAGARTIIAIICGVFIVFMTIFLVPLSKIDFGLGWLFFISGLSAGLCEYFLPNMLYEKPMYINKDNEQSA